MNLLLVSFVVGAPIGLMFTAARFLARPARVTHAPIRPHEAYAFDDSDWRMRSW